MKMIKEIWYAYSLFFYLIYSFLKMGIMDIPMVVNIVKILYENKLLLDFTVEIKKEKIL